jgi:hypothetical protein
MVRGAAVEGSQALQGPATAGEGAGSDAGAGGPAVVGPRATELSLSG